MNFKPNQQLAIDNLGQNVVVPASAGAGKTAVLIERLMKRILIDQVELDEICAMTFTEAAASEMKVRLMKALNEKQKETPSAFITKQISLLETAHISTIHSFCLNIVKNYGYIIGVNPDRTKNILPPAELTILQEQVIKKVLDDYIDTHFLQAKDLLDTFNSNPLNFSALETAIIKIAHWISEQSRPQEAINKLLQNYSVQSLNDLTDDYKSYLFHYYDLQFQQLINALEMTTDAADKALNFKANDKVQPLIDNMKVKHGTIIHLHQKIKTKDLSFYDEIIDALNIQIPTIQKDDDYKVATATLVELITSLVKRHQSEAKEVEQLNAQLPLVEQLITLATTFIKEMNQKKEELKVLDFSDFEPMALEILLAENGAIAKIMQDKFKEIMVDEFQDTNTYQDEIIKLISNGYNIFRVGDVKQAIYGFRGGKPAIMQEIIATKQSEIIPISYNFRSKYDIVHFNNVTFQQIMDLTVNTKYTPDDIVETGTPGQEVESHKVEFHIIQTNADMPEETEEDVIEESDINEPKLNIDPADVISAQYIAQKIVSLVKSGEARFKDITILVRAHHLKDLLKEAFDAVNIPYFLNEQSGYYKSEVVASTIHLLRYLNTPNNYDLTKVLMSSYYHLTLDQIAELKISHQHLHDGIKLNFPEIDNQLNSLKMLVLKSDIVTLIQAIANLNNAYNTYFSIQDKTNMDALLDKAVEYQNNNAITITGFISYLESLVDEKSSEASPIASDEDVVTAMTIHQSKGLQFPIVFLFGLGRNISREDKEFLVTDDELGFVMNSIDLEYRLTNYTLLRRIMNHKRDHESVEEGMRLLYVALTRAQSRMFIVDAVKEFTEEHQFAELDETLLFKHKRKVHLLVPASKNTAIINISNLDDIPQDSFDDVKLDTEQYNQPLQTHLVLQDPLRIPFENTPLNLNRSSIHAMDYGTKIHEYIESLPNALWLQESIDTIEPRFLKTLLDYNTHSKTLDIYNNHQEFYNELAYIVQLDDAIDNGIMDYVAISDKHITLVDFKTDNETKEVIIERYTNQIEGYKKALSILYPGLQINTYIYSFHLKDYIVL